MKYALKPGTHLGDQELIETGPKTAIVRLEFTSGMMINLGPTTRVILSPKLGDGSLLLQPALYAINGWIKISHSSDMDGPNAVQILAESMAISKVVGSAVIWVHDSANQVFSEAGTLAINERRNGKSMPIVTLKSGSFFSKTGGTKASVSGTPPATFVQDVPKAFLDTIPSLASRFKGNRPPPAKLIGELSYEDALPWLGAERDVKYFLVTSWRQNLNRSLRAGLTSHIRTHQEWDRTLFPENHLPPKKSPVPAVNE
jgi:hypothetical protein